MRRLLQERDTLSVVNDQIGSPTYAADLAQAMMDIVTAKNGFPGIYNYSNEGEISWYEFVLAIQEMEDILRSEGYSFIILSLQTKRPAFLYWIKPRLKEYMVLAFQIIRIV
jgi:dTDP-4-dehydrorhamnose reductase